MQRAIQARPVPLWLHGAKIYAGHSDELPMAGGSKSIEGLTVLTSSDSSRTRQRKARRWWLWLPVAAIAARSEEHTSELQSRENLVCRLLLEKKKIEN